MARKVFISILGTGFYGKCKYVSEDFCSTKTRFAQQAALELIKAHEWGENGACYIFTTEKAYAENWDISQRTNNHTKKIEKYTGLETILKNINLPFKPSNQFIPDGKNDEEMWEIFDVIFNLLENKDELYVDLTHSFRYLPMLLLVLNNYAKFLRNVVIKHISYGNYEARDKDTNEAPIVDLLPISALQDWTFAAADYLENGNTERLTLLSKNTIAPILRSNDLRDENSQLLNKLVTVLQKTTQDFQTCRGMNIVNSVHLKELKKLLIDTETSFIKPLYPIMKKIEESFSPFDVNQNIKNGFHAAQWCYDNGLYQQAATILQENIVSFFCEKHSIKIDDEELRVLVNQAFFLNKQQNTKETHDTKDIEETENTEDIKSKDKVEITASILHELINDPILNNIDIINSFDRLTQLRNDINHFGMRSKRKPMKIKKIKDTLQSEIDIIFSNIVNS